MLKDAIRWGNVVRDRVAERALPHPVVFHHVPKCGGTSVESVLRRRYLVSQVILIPEATREAVSTVDWSEDAGPPNTVKYRFREELLAYHLHLGTRCVTGHVRFNRRIHGAFRDRYAFITILRDPVERFVSHFFFRDFKNAASDEDATATFANFLETDEARRYGAQYAFFFGGEPLGRGDPLGPEAVAAAKANLAAFDVVGFLEDMPAFAERLNARLGARLKFGHENRNPKNTRDRLPAELIDRVHELTAPSREIYDAAWAAHQRSDAPADKAA